MNKWTLGLCMFAHILVLVIMTFVIVPAAQLTLSILDVGQGDATLLVTAKGKVVLIDAGPGQNVLAPLSKALPPFVRHIDLLVLTHPHADHIDGALALLPRYSLGGVIITNVAYKSVNFTRFIAEIHKKNIPLFVAQADMDWQLENGVIVDILFPFTAISQKNFRNVNNSSLVFLLSTPYTRCLFTGDMEKELETLLLRYYQNLLAASYLKVAHHGSKTSSSPAFLQMVRPKEMWISVGKKNKFKSLNRKSCKNTQNLAISTIAT